MSVIDNSLLLGSEGGLVSDYQISRSVRLRASATAYLNRTPAVAGSQTTWTWSGWVKRGAIGTRQFITMSGVNPNPTQVWQVEFDANDKLSFYNQTINIYRLSTQVFRDPSAWYHIVFCADTTNATAQNRFRCWVNGVEITAWDTNSVIALNYTFAYNGAYLHGIGAYTYSPSLYYDGYLTEINFIDGQALTPSSFGENNAITGIWQPKEYLGTYGTNGFYLPFSNNVTTNNLATNSELVGGTGWTNNTMTVSTNSIVAPNGSTTASSLTSTSSDGFSYGITGTVASGATFTFSIWLKAPSTTNINLYMGRNGTSNYQSFPITVTTTWTRFTATFTTSGTTIAYLIGGGASITNGEVIHAWGAQVNNGSVVQQYLKTTTVAVSAIPAFGQDFSLGDASYNTWTPNNISLTAGATYDSMIDTPTPYDDGGNGRGNYCTLNPLFIDPPITLSAGNLNSVTTTAGNWSGAGGTIAVTSGKWYWESTVLSGISGAEETRLGINATTSIIPNVGGTSAASYVYGNLGNKYNNSVTTAYGATYTNLDVIGVALDMDAKTLTFYKNNVSQGVAYTSLSGEFVPAVTHSSAPAVATNFGQRPFTYTPPTGFKALNTQNLPNSTITNGATYMAATLYTGNGSTQNISNSAKGVSFQPGLVWLKSRSAATNNRVYDSVRGVNLVLASNATDAEATPGGTGGVTAFNSDGFSLGSAGSDNNNAATYVGWQWKAGDTVVTNTDGSITTQVSVNRSAGFSVVTYTGNGVAGATAGHGLGNSPSMVILKTLGINNWPVFHSGNATPARDIFYLNLTNAVAVNNTFWNNVSPSSSLITLGTNAHTNSSAVDYVAYCWAAVAGYSAFGSYTGNGLANGPFVYTGFKPRWIMIRYATAVANWLIWDTSRTTSNVMGEELYPNLTTIGTVATDLDILSNGFKIRNTTAAFNASGGLFVYAAFAENPFKYALAR